MVVWLASLLMVVRAVSPLPGFVSGELRFAVRGLPRGVSANILVEGPGGFTRQVDSTGILQELPPGEYHLSFAPVVGPEYSYAAPAGGQDVRVRADSRITVDVLYLESDGALRLRMLGLPADSHPHVTVTAPDGSRTVVEDSATTLRHLVPGAYLIEAGPGQGRSTVTTPTPARQMRRVEIGRTLDVTISYSGELPPLPKGRLEPLPPGFNDMMISVGGARLGIKVFIPAGYDPGREWPVILSMHGSGERGNDNNAQLRSGLGKYLRAHVSDFPAVVVLPQIPAGAPPAGVSPATWMNEIFTTALDQVLHLVHADNSRIYMTGVSLGGFRTWMIAYQHPTEFAAIAPVAGGVVPAELGVATMPEAARLVASRLRDLPVWQWGGDRDGTVPLATYGYPLRDAFTALGPPETYRFVIGQGLGHDLEANYNDPAFWTWLFAQHR